MKNRLKRLIAHPFHSKDVGAAILKESVVTQLSDTE